MLVRSFKDLLVWQKAMDLLIGVYRVTTSYPVEERFGLVAHTRRTAVSIPSNIAEGYARHSRVEYARFVEIAYGSAAELETQLIAAVRLGFLPTNERGAFDLLSEVERMLASLRRSLRSHAPKPSIP